MGSGFGNRRNASEGSDVNVGSVDRAREAVKETLRLYRSHISMIASGGGAGEMEKRIDFQAKKELEAQGKLGKPVKVVGAMPGVEVGDEFYYRVELFIIGLHGRLLKGIGYLEKHGSKLATCMVATEGYYVDMTESEFLEYTGEGGVYMDKGKQPDNQKMAGGNLALKNSMMSKSPVRVVRGFKLGFHAGDPDPRTAKTTYVYDGLYDVMDCKKGKGSKGNLIYMFTLRRDPNQPVVYWKKRECGSYFDALVYGEILQ